PRRRARENRPSGSREPDARRASSALAYPARARLFRANGTGSSGAVRALLQPGEQQAHAHARPAAPALVVALLRAPGRAGDVEVRPGRLGHEVREERGPGRGPGALTGIDVLEVAYRALHV